MTAKFERYRDLARPAARTASSRNGRHRSPASHGLLAAVLGVATLQAMAQTPPDTGRLMRDQERQLVPEPGRPLSLPRLELREQARPAVQDADGVRLRVATFRFNGNTVFPDATLGALLADLVGQQLALADLDNAAARVTAYYRRQGYVVANAYLPAQDIRDGVVEIRILEGTLGKLQVENHSPVADHVVLAMLSDLQAGRPLVGDSLERALLLVSGLAGGDVQSTLKPGASVGTTDLDIRIGGQERITGSLGADDYGNRYTGMWRAGATLNVKSPLALGDTLSLRVNTSDYRFRYGRLAYQFPVAGRGLQVGAAGSAMTYRLGGEFIALQAHGTAHIASVYALYPLQRSRSANLNLQADLERKRLDDRTDSTEARTSKRVQLLTLGISGDRADALLGGGWTSWSLAYSRGQLSLDPEAAELDALARRTNGRYGKLVITAVRQQSLAFAPSWNLAGQVSGQRGDKNLDSSDKLGLGGVQGVRAYPQGEAACDDAWLANLELRYTPSPAWQLAGFYDAGGGRVDHAATAADGPRHHRLSGAGLSASLIGPGDVSVVAAVAWPTGKATVPRREHESRWWMNIQKRF